VTPEPEKDAGMKDFLESFYYRLTDRWTSRPRQVYDGFTFFNELEILKLRLQELYDQVDKFVLVESTLTHQNQPKPLYFQENKDQFREFNDKIIHIIVEDMPGTADPWVNERHQRNCITRGLTHCRDYDIVMVADVDEIPNHQAVAYYKKNHFFNIKRLDQKFYYYYLNNDTNCSWRLAYIASFCNIKDKELSAIRKAKIKKRDLIPNGGWHFSFLGGVDNIIKKIEAFAHNEYNLEQYKDRERLINCLHNGKDLFGRGDYKYQFVNIDESFPEYVINNIEYYRQIGWIK